VVLLVLIFVGVVVVAYAADRVWKARAQFRRLHTMNSRLAEATARAERQHEQVEAREKASAELTAFMPAINRPPSSLPGMPARRKAHKAGGRDRSATPASRPDNRPAADRAPRRPAAAAPKQSQPPEQAQSPEQPASTPLPEPSPKLSAEPMRPDQLEDTLL